MKNSIAEVLDKLSEQSRKEKSREINMPPEDRMLAITKETGELINMILRLKKAKNMLEIGTSVGYSTIWCAEAISERSGKIITIEKNPNKIKRAQTNFDKAGVANTILIMDGEALQILTELSLQKEYVEFFDCVLIDADKENIIEYFDLILPLIAKNGIIITDNMLYPEKYRDKMKKFSEHLKKNPNLITITSPIGNGIEITMKVQ